MYNRGSINRRSVDYIIVSLHARSVHATGIAHDLILATVWVLEFILDVNTEKTNVKNSFFPVKRINMFYIDVPSSQYYPIHISPPYTAG